MNSYKREQLEKTYNTLINVALQNHPISEISDHLDADFMGYGSALDEKLHGWEGVKWMIERQRQELNNQKSTIKRYPVESVIFNNDTAALKVEEIEITVDMGDEPHGFTIRLSTLLEYKGVKWMVRHFHGSTADADTPEGNAWPIEEWKRRNAELQRAVDEKTAELQKRNRELEVEAALERVRAASMVMRTTAELSNVITILFDQFQSLEIDIITTFIGIHHLEEGFISMWYSPLKGIMDEAFNVKLPTAPFEDTTIKAWREGQEFSYISISGIEAVEQFAKQVDALLGWKVFYELFKKEQFSNIEQTEANHLFGNISIKQVRKATEAEKSILKQFAHVFEQCYIRFLDLQKAEAQARDAQIEAALERIRSKSMGMQKSDELYDVILEIHKKFEELDISMESRIAIVAVLNSDSKDFNQYIASQDVGNIYISTPYFEHPILDDFYEAKEAGVEFFSKSYTEEEKNSYFKRFFETSFTSAEIAGLEEQAKWVFAQKFYTHSQAFQKNSCIGMADYSGIPLNEYEIDIIIRFSKVFDQAYTRFLDLQKAEAQAREAQIEAALERVRAQTMAMHNSEDVGKCTVKMFSEVTALGVDEGTRFGIGILNHDNEKNQLWTASKEGKEVKMHKGHIDMNWHPLLQSARKAWKEQVPVHRYVLEGEDLQNYYQVLNNAPDYPLSIPIDKLPERQFHYGFVFEHGFFYAFSPSEFQHDLIRILQRFSSLFGQTYRRYLDLVTAEEQTREAQLELSLERIRAAATAMKQSEDLLDIVVKMRSEFVSLGHDAHYFWHMKWAPETYYKAMTSGDGTRIGMVMQLPRKIHLEIPSLGAWEKSGEPTVVHVMDVDATLDYIHKMAAWGDFQRIDPNMPTEDDIRQIGGLTYVMARTMHGEIGYSLPGMVPDPSAEAVKTLQRFADTFDLAYRRFEDLQKAEAQAREAQIQLALERVRARSMAMQSTDELHDVLSVLFRQFDHIGIHPVNVFLSLFDRENRTLTYRASGKSGTRLPIKQVVHVDSMEPLKVLYEKFIHDNSDSVEVIFYPKEVLPQLFGLFSETFDSMPEGDRMGTVDFPEGGYSMAGYTPFGYLGYDHQRQATEEEKDILSRFCLEFTRVYQRFLDIQKVEAQAREAQIEAALERVRAVSMAMHKSEDLINVATVMNLEFQKLGITQSVQSSFVLIDEEKEVQYLWGAQTDTKLLEFVTLPLFGDDVLQARYEAWKRKDPVFVAVLSDKHLNKHNEVVKPVEGRTESETEGFKSLPDPCHFCCGNFKYGYLFLISTDILAEDQQKIVARMAKVFEQTYTRFLDLQKAEEQSKMIREERDRLNATLKDLKATQAQLIQSEKMASLGELTAGIAHEIQNPLNFVNNFSEVSNELIDEMKEEFEKGDKEEAFAIADDIKQNLEKINHHGKRADAIVKGMLQHSRTSAGQKEPTDINALADEYLRLAYHGIRAKDSSFNADFSTDFDPNLPKVNVISQDIGRVLLNLINNAFYAVYERSQKESVGYQPMVKISTLKTPSSQEGAGGVVITVSDNGPGIPESIKEKIFQPFFTTKPTGQGTGLGLSLSYDIVKAHGGELTMESEIGEGTEFIINLPII